MRARCRNFECAPRDELPAYLRHVFRIYFASLMRFSGNVLRQRRRAMEAFIRLAQVLRAIDRNPFDERRFGSVFGRDDDVLEPRTPRSQYERQNATDRTNLPRQSQFPHDHRLVEPVLNCWAKLAIGLQYRYGYRQIIRRTIFADIGRRQIQRHASLRKIQIRFHKCRSNPDLRLADCPLC